MRITPSDHAEALALARRLERADAFSAEEDRRALLLFWYGTGGSRLRAEQDALLAAWERHGGLDHPLDAAMRAELDRLAASVAAIAADAAPATADVRWLGARLADLLRRQDQVLCAVVGRAIPPGELAEVQRALHALHASSRDPS